MLNIEKVNLYDHYGLEKLPERTGNLTCIYFSTGWEISTSRVRPAVLIMPGGGYHAVSDREAEPIALRFANRGYAAFVLRYSVKPNVFPTSLRECAMAMKYIRENCEKFEVDPSMVAAIGFSAGGHLCGTLGTMYDAPEIADIAPAEIVCPTAIGLCYPVAVSWGDTHADSFINLTNNDEKLIERLSVDKLVRTDMPPAFIWHTRNDALVPCRNSLVLAQAMNDMGVDYSLRIYHNGQHGLATADETTYPVENVPSISKEIIGWEDHMIEFFQECGLKMWDK